MSDSSYIAPFGKFGSTKVGADVTPSQILIPPVRSASPVLELFCSESFMNFITSIPAIVRVTDLVAVSVLYASEYMLTVRLFDPDADDFTNST